MTKYEQNAYFTQAAKMSGADRYAFTLWCADHGYRPSLVRLAQWDAIPANDNDAVEFSNAASRHHY